MPDPLYGTPDLLQSGDGAGDDIGSSVDLASGHFDGGTGTDTRTLYWYQIRAGPRTTRPSGGQGGDRSPAGDPDRRAAAVRHRHLHRMTPRRPDAQQQDCATPMHLQ